MSISYQLVNPQIKGSLETNVTADNSIKAARKIYEGLSEHFNNNVPIFHFTIQKGSSGKGKYYHFKVTEEKNDNEVSYTLESYKIKNESTNLKTFEGKKEQFLKNQAGGAKVRKHKKDVDMDSDELYEFDERLATKSAPGITYSPIYWWWYDPHMYELEYVYVPTFYPYVTPFVEIVLF